MLALLLSPEVRAERVISSVGELNALLSGTDTALHHYCITGLITFVNHRQDEQCPFILEEGDQRVSILSGVPSPEVGAIVAASGYAIVSSNYEPWAYCRSIATLGRGKIAEPPHASLADIAGGRYDLKAVIAEAMLSDILQDELDPNYIYLLLKDGPTTLPAYCKAPHDLNLRKLIDARIAFRGVVLKHVSGQRKFLGRCLSPDTPDNISVVTPPPPDPFDFPSLPKQLYLTPQEVALLGKRSVSGKVIAAWQKNRVYIRRDDGQIVGAALSEGQSLPKCGLYATAVGTPETDLFRINLSGARIRVDANIKPVPDEPPAETDFDKLLAKINGTMVFTDDARGKLVTLTGIVRTLPDANSDGKCLVLDCGRHILSVDYSANPDAADKVKLGCEVRVTGRFIIVTDSWQPNKIFPRINGITLVIRSPDDIRILSYPSWWTSQRLFGLIVALVLAILALCGWNRLLRRLIDKRSRELYRAEIDRTKTELKIDERTRLAVELHDSLSQSLAGIAYQLTSCGDAVKADADAALQRIETADRMLKSCRTELRHRLHDLRSDMLEEPDFAEAIRKTISQLEGDASIVLRVNVRRSLLDDTTAQSILSVIRELVSNALRHGQAKTVRIAGCAERDMLRFSVKDDGIGFDPLNCPGVRQGHFGIVGIRYRLKRLNGDLSIESSSGTGARVVFEIPLPPDGNTPGRHRK